MDIINIKDGNDLLAILVRGNILKKGIDFVTPEHFPLQLGYLFHDKGHKIPPHRHLNIRIDRDFEVQEFFYILKGKIKITIYNKDNKKVRDYILGKNDGILLSCGHSLDFLEDTKMFEIKQGYYRSKEKEKIMI